MKIRKIYLPIIFLAALFGCSDQDIDATQTEDLNQEIYFEVSHNNSAWGTVHRGFLIDHTGAVRTYLNPADWNISSELDKGALSAKQIEENIAKTQVSSVTVDASQLKALTDKIPTLSTSTYTKRVQAGKDMGQTNFYAYRYDSKKDAYIPILLSETGDWQSQNTDKSAIEISEWLQKIQTSIK
ncbi:MAG TPA: hypothetical protein VGN64_09005 [Dyadobacter sp.]|jgi:gamma-glutamylcyclotransferase (GGCT)/AIG2-like uncharacterized protein YtfP|nr:hypothetical protein [Dyadobacter sp.]